MPLTLPFDNSYARLPGRLFSYQAPSPVTTPELLAFNAPLATSLGLDPSVLSSADGIAMLSGSIVPEGATPISQVYAGHQFGGWVPRLGDGRAVLLGEVVAPDGRRVDLQLKGSGRTPFSRSGDGRAWIGPVIREYMVSEAMHAMGVPTTRALAAVATGETVLRETPLPGAVLTRIAASHVRVGTFQYLYARQDIDGLRALTDHVIARHYPDAIDAFGLLEAVIDAQARLIASWMGVGFIHGVMNTDNVSIAGETIDYGPCAFMDGYHPETVFSSIDRFGRYAYARQPEIAVWNLAQFATTLLPLVSERDTAIDEATDLVNDFGPRFQRAWRDIFRGKLGLLEAKEEDEALIRELLTLMAQDRADFTKVFHGLADGTAGDWFTDRPAFDAWAAKWSERAARETADPGVRRSLMRRSNPAVIPRNHHVEAVIAAATRGDLGPFQDLLRATSNPFTDHPVFGKPPAPGEEIAATFCGT